MIVLPAACSGKKVQDATGLVVRGGGTISTLNLIAGAGAVATAVINDSTDGLGTDIWVLSALASDNNPCSFSQPIPFSSGLYVTLTGAGAKLSIAYN